MSILIGNTYYTNISPVMTSNTAPSPYVAECSINCVNVIWKALDGNIDSYFRTNIQTVTPFTISLDYGEGNEKVVSAYILDCHYNVSFTMKSWNFEGSNDNNTWDILDSRSDISWSENAIQTFVFDNSTKYRYYRFNILEKNGTNSVCINEIELLQEDSTSNLEFRKVKKSNLPNSKTDGVDAVYFTEDGEMYITDKNGNLKQSCGTKISADSNNAIKTKTDGLFVEDKTDAIKAVDDKVNSISKFQKYVNAGLDYCYLTISSAYSAQKISVDDIIGFDTAKECNNMKYDLSNHTITLSKGKTYKLSCNLCIVYGEMQYELLDITNNVSLRLIRSVVPDSTSVASPVDCKCIYTPETDCQIQVQVRQSKATSSSSTGTTPQYPTVVTDFGYFIAEEIGRAIAIDPLEYVNSSSGIEDTPVGQIISVMGNTVPKHYLACDGAEYNITDYPHLTQHFIDQFGTANYFGGDGITTFAVPGKPINASVLKLNPTMTSNTTPEGQVIYNNLFEDFKPYMVFGDSNSTSEKACYVAHTKPSYLGYKFANPTIITAYSLQPRGHLDRNTISGTPSDWELQASNDMKNWVTLDTQSGITWTSTSDVQVFCFNNTTAYQAYRIYATNSANTDSFIIIGNLKFGIPEIKEASYIKYEPTYFMKNTYSANSVYSTEEHIVGRWIDGRPLYSCTCSIQSDTSAGMKTYYYTQITNADYVRVDFEGSFLYNESTKETISLFNNWDSTTYGLGLTAFGEETQIRVSMYRPIWYDLPGYITFIYTKTTDSPSSSTITPESGSCSCVNYTDEEIQEAVATVLGGTE